jgi:hypothetical protein
MISYLGDVYTLKFQGKVKASIGQRDGSTLLVRIHHNQIINKNYIIRGFLDLSMSFE